MGSRFLPNHDKKATINFQTGSSKTKQKQKKKTQKIKKC